MGKVIDLTAHFDKRQYTPLVADDEQLKHMAGQHDQRTHTPKRYIGGGKAMRVRDDIPGDYIDQAMSDLFHKGMEVSQGGLTYSEELPGLPMGTLEKQVRATAERISKQTGLDEDDVELVTYKWASQFADQMQPEYYGIRRGIAEEFGLEDTLPDWFEEGEQSVLKPGLPPDAPEWVAGSTKQRHYDRTRRASGVAARAMYEETQRQLADAGIDEVVVYRGRISDASRKMSVGDTVGVTSSSASSWSLDPSVASRFADDEYKLTGDNAGVVLQATVPASRVLSYYKTGFGTDDEFEIVVLENPDVEDQVRVTKRYTE
jgi:hypothetical protein